MGNISSTRWRSPPVTLSPPRQTAAPMAPYFPLPMPHCSGGFAILLSFGGLLLREFQGVSAPFSNRCFFGNRGPTPSVLSVDMEPILYQNLIQGYNGTG